MVRRRWGTRGEGHVEYVIITCTIMVCAVVGLFSVWSDIGRMAGKLRLCVDCPDDQDLYDERIDPAERTDETHAEDDSSTEGDGDPPPLTEEERNEIMAAIFRIYELLFGGYGMSRFFGLRSA